MQDFGVSTTQTCPLKSVLKSVRPRLLIVEDEMTLVAVLEDMADYLGYDVAGSAATVGAAIGLAQRDDFDIALLDVELDGGQSSAAVAEMLESRGIPYLFLGGYGADAAGRGQSLCKPFIVTDLGDALVRVSLAHTEPSISLLA